MRMGVMIEMQRGEKRKKKKKKNREKERVNYQNGM